MSVYDRMEEAGHDLVLVNGLQAGISTYACENCGALVKLRNGEVILFHVAPASATSRVDQCYPGDPPPAGRELLRDKMKRLDEDETERFRKMMEGSE